MTTALPYAVTEAAGLPETLLPEALVERLPDPSAVAPAPWHTKCQVVSWLHPVDDGALELIPAAIRPESIATVAWALVRYDETPVGPYSELAATLLADDGIGHIPFIVVDSLTSIVGGRANWLLPKALAEFTWSNDFDSVAVKPVEPTQPSWTASVAVAPTGDAQPLTIPSQLRQAATNGSAGGCEGSMSGAMRSATVTVQATADGPLAMLLMSGRYDGTVLTDAEFCCGPLT